MEKQTKHTSACALSGNELPCADCMRVMLGPENSVLNLHRTENACSIEIGGAKTGSVKVYFDADKPEEADVKIDAAIKLLLKHREKVLGV